MTNVTDDLEAVRVLITTLENFGAEEQDRIIRWACEKLGIAVPESKSAGGADKKTKDPLNPPPAKTDIKSFVTDKKPRSDTQFAAAVAYFYEFEAPIEERKDAINSEILQDACRKVGRSRLADPNKTLNNAMAGGMMDRGTERGHFKINSIGENLVAMVLPDGSISTVKSRPKTKAKKKAKTKAKKKAKAKAKKKVKAKAKKKVKKK